MDVASATPSNASEPGSVYRDARDVIRVRLATAVKALHSRVEAPVVRRIVARRAARSMAGVVGIAGAAWLACSALHAAVQPNGSFGGAEEMVDGLPRVLLLSVAASLVAWPLAWLAGALFARPMLHRSIVSLVRALPDPLAGADDLNAPDVLGRILARAGVGDVSSIALPLVALSLLAPLTLHRLLYGVTNEPTHFGQWISISLAIVGHCHLLLAYFALRFARSLARSPDEVGSGMHAGWRALGWTTLASLLPGIVLLGVPVAIVAVTGAVFVPVAWAWAASRARTERGQLAL